MTKVSFLPFHHPQIEIEIGNETGSQYINRLKKLGAEETPKLRSPESSIIISSEQKKHMDATTLHGKQRWAEIVRKKVIKPGSKHTRQSFKIAGSEHMSAVDCIDGAALRGGLKGDKSRTEEEEAKLKTDLVVVSLVADGRFEDVARPSGSS